MYEYEHHDKALISVVWEHARAMPEFDPNQWRQDPCGAWIRRDQYMQRSSEFAWRILDIVADHPGEPDTLRAFHVGNTFNVGHGRPVCRVRADQKGFAGRGTRTSPRNVAVGD